MSLPLDEGGPTLTAELRALVARDAFPRRAWVNLWTVRSSHQYWLLPEASDAEMVSMARRHAVSLHGMHDADVTVATTMGSLRGESSDQPKREVSFFAAASHDIRKQLRPIVDAGFVVEGVTTPCGALWSQARLRRPALPDAVHAHVALGRGQSALGIFTNGSLLYARDLDWGYAVDGTGTPIPRERDEIANRLAVDLRRSFLYVKQFWEEEISQVLLCGDMPEIRSLTAPLIERLNIEVETLDTLEGIDAAWLPDGFADRVAGFRLAAAMAVDPPPVNLLPLEMAADRGRSTRWILAAGTAAAVALGAGLYAQAGMARADTERRLSLVQRELSQLKPGASAVPASQGRANVETVVPAAPGRPAAQGPAFARVLSALGTAVPAEVRVTSMRALPDGEHWQVTIEAFAAAGGSTPPDVALDAFLLALQESSWFGHPLGLPVRRMVGGGVELGAAFRVPQ